MATFGGPAGAGCFAKDGRGSVEDYNPLMPKARSTPRGYERAHALRKSTTPAEGRLWARLRGNRLGGVGFRRQHAIGPYVVDFCASKLKLVVELDGGQHVDQTQYDAERTAFLENEGYRVVRFWNSDVERDLDGTLAAILEAMRLV
jgi:very-short-patch-repair endonuclease